MHHNWSHEILLVPFFTTIGAGQYGGLDTLNSKIHTLFKILDTDPGWYSNSGKIAATIPEQQEEEEEEQQEQYTWLVASD